MDPDLSKHRLGGDGVRLTSVQPHPYVTTLTAKIGEFGEVPALTRPNASRCVPIKPRYYRGTVMGTLCSWCHDGST